MSARISLESYAHKAAKDVVIGWFRASAVGHVDEWTTALGYDWRVNRGGPEFGVYAECPILANGMGMDHVWDEITDDGKIPTYEQLKSEGEAPRAILDIAVQHKGVVTLGIEIVHKHPMSDEKLDFLHEVGLQSLLVLPAKWVLGQVRQPKFAPAKFWMWGAR